MSTVTIQKRKRKHGTTYPVYFKNPFNYRKEYFKTFPKLKEAQIAANELRALLDAGKVPQKKRLKLNPLTFKKVGDSLKKRWGTKLKRQDLREKTYIDYCYWLDGLNRFFGNKLLCQISKDEIESLINVWASDKTKVTSNKYLFILKQVFKVGLDLNAVIEDPVAELKYFSEKDHERNEFLLPGKLALVIEASQDTRSKFYLPAAIYLGAEHSASTQEILDLNWKDIDFDFADRGLIKFFRTKNKRKRAEFLMPRTKGALLSWREHLEWKRNKKKIIEPKSDRVFCRIDGTPLRSIRKAWKNTLKKAGITGLHFHDLRHTFASNMLLSGASLKDVKEMMGHADISMTDRYSHLTVTHKTQIQDKLADHYMIGVT